MAHTIGTLPARATGAGNPVTFSQAVLSGETVFVLMIKTVGAVDRAGGAPTWGGFTFTQANSTQKAAASPEAGCELWYILNPLPRTDTVTIPNTGALTLFWQPAMAKAAAGGFSAFDQANGGNNTSTNPTPGSVTTTQDGDALFAVTAGGWQAWAPSAQAGTIISNNDDGANGGGTQYLMQATLAAIDMNWTFATSDDWGAVMAAFKEVAPRNLENYKFVDAGDGISVSEKIR